MGMQAGACLEPEGRLRGRICGMTPPASSRPRRPRLDHDHRPTRRQRARRAARSTSASPRRGRGSAGAGGRPLSPRGRGTSAAPTLTDALITDSPSRGQRETLAARRRRKRASAARGRSPRRLPVALGGSEALPTLWFPAGPPTRGAGEGAGPDSWGTDCARRGRGGGPHSRRAGPQVKEGGVKYQGGRGWDRGKVRARARCCVAWGQGADPDEAGGERPEGRPDRPRAPLVTLRAAGPRVGSVCGLLPGRTHLLGLFQAQDSRDAAAPAVPSVVPGRAARWGAEEPCGESWCLSRVWSCLGHRRMWRGTDSPEMRLGGLQKG